MRNVTSIFKREFLAYFNSSIAYVFIIVFLLVTTGLYMSAFFLNERLEMRPFFALLPMVLVVFIPAVTMRLWAEEKKLGTMELLMTLPMESWQIVLGKFFAALAFYVIALLGTVSIPILLGALGSPDFGPIWGGYIGSALLGAFFLAVGMFISGMCRDQIVAFIIGLVACFAFFMVGTDYIAGLVDGWSGRLGLGTFLQNYVGITKHFSGVERGVIDLRDIIYFVSMTALFLSLNTYSLEGRKY